MIAFIIGAVVGGAVTFVLIWWQQFCGAAMAKAIKEELDRERQQATKHES